MRGKQQYNRYEDGIDIFEVVRMFWSQKVLIIALTIICGLLMFVKTYYFTDEQYSASGILYVSNRMESANDTKISKTDIDTARILSTTYMEILKTSFFMEEVGQSVGGYSWKQIYKMTSFSTVNNTELLEITVRADDAMDAYNIAKTIIDKAPDKLKSVYRSGEAEIVDPPRVPVLPDSKGTLRNTVIGAFAGAVIAAAIIFIKSFFDTKVRKSEDLVKRYEICVLGEVAE